MKIAPLALLLVALLFTSCVNRTEARREGCQIKVGIVFDIGGKNDRSFNAAAWEGVKRAEHDLHHHRQHRRPGL